MSNGEVRSAVGGRGTPRSAGPAPPQCPPVTFARSSRFTTPSSAASRRLRLDTHQAWPWPARCCGGDRYLVDCLISECRDVDAACGWWKVVHCDSDEPFRTTLRIPQARITGRSYDKCPRRVILPTFERSRTSIGVAATPPRRPHPSGVRTTIDRVV